MAVKKAVVLAAGLGTRLRPMTDVRPKPLLPVWGQPMLERALDMLVSWGVEEIAVNAHHLADQVEAYVKAYAAGSGVKVFVSREERILGTGGALRPLRSWLGEEPFWLVNGDVVVEGLDPEPIEEAFGRSGRFAACWMAGGVGPRTIEADPEGRICDWRSPSPGVDGTYTYCGVALLSPAVAGFLPEAPCCSVVEAYERAMYGEGRFVVGVEEPEAFWCDAGTIESYREVNDGPQPLSLYGDARLEALCAALKWKSEAAGAEFLCVRGSDRSFWRIDNGKETVVAVAYDDAARPENARYAAHARTLAAHGVPVPGVFADLPERRILALEELDGGSLDVRANAPGADFVKLYAPVLAALKRFHAVPADALALEPPFGEDLYRWEHDLFETHAVKGHWALADGLPDAVRAELRAVGRRLAAVPQTLVHRDSQSSNVLYRSGRDEPVFIDFQGMRLGPPAYDVASLLYDPYVPMPQSARAKLIGLYPAPALAEAAVERLVQALGAFGRLAGVGQGRFLKYVPQALETLHVCAHAAALPSLSEFTHHLMERELYRRRGVAGR